MKKLLSILFCLVLVFSVCACGEKTEEPIENNETMLKEENKEETEDALDEGNKEIPPTVETSMIYMPFDEIIEESTDIIKGRVIEREIKAGEVDFEVEVIERYKGEEVEGNITLNTSYTYFPNMNVEEMNNSDMEWTYVRGKEYYFFLNRRKSVYFEEDLYLPKGKIFIPAEDIQKSTFYDKPLYEEIDIPENFDEQTLVEYIKKVAEIRKGDGKTYTGLAYTESTDLKTIIEEAKWVVIVKVVDIETKVFNATYNIYDCEIIEVLKGNIKEEKEVTILIPKDIAKIGKEYFFALDKWDDSSNYRFSSKNSALDIKQYDEIKGYIK